MPDQATTGVLVVDEPVPIADVALPRLHRGRQGHSRGIGIGARLEGDGGGVHARLKADRERRGTILYVEPPGRRTDSSAPPVEGREARGIRAEDPAAIRREGGMDRRLPLPCAHPVPRTFAAHRAGRHEI